MRNPNSLGIGGRRGAGEGFIDRLLLTTYALLFLSNISPPSIGYENVLHRANLIHN